MSGANAILSRVFILPVKLVKLTSPSRQVWNVSSCPRPWSRQSTLSCQPITQWQVRLSSLVPGKTVSSLKLAPWLHIWTQQWWDGTYDKWGTWKDAKSVFDFDWESGNQWPWSATRNTGCLGTSSRSEEGGKQALTLYFLIRVHVKNLNTLFP